MTITILQQENEALKQTVQTLEQLVNQLQKALKWANAKYDALEKKVYGSSSEKVTREDLRRFLPGLANVEGDIHGPAKSESYVVRRTKQRLEKSSALRFEIPAHVERRRVEVPAPQEVLNNPQEWEKIGEETGERLGLDPANPYAQVLVVGKYKSRVEKKQIVQAPVPPTLAEKCLVTPEVGGT